MDLFARESSVKLELHRVPFFLEPDYHAMPEGWWEPHQTRMVRKFGSEEAFDRVKAAHRLMPRAAEAGLASDGWSEDGLARRRQSSTLRSHRLVWWVGRRLGWEAAETVYSHLNHAHFVEAQLLNDVGLLVAAAAAVGLDATEVEAFVRSDEGESEVLQAAQVVQRLGIHSIPTLVVDGLVTVSGAAASDEVLDALRSCAARGVSGGRLVAGAPPRRPRCATDAKTGVAA